MTRALGGVADTIGATHSKKLTTQDLKMQRLVIAQVRDYDTRTVSI